MTFEKPTDAELLALARRQIESYDYDDLMEMVIDDRLREFKDNPSWALMWINDEAEVYGQTPQEYFDETTKGPKV